ncbi:MAG: TIR domain-containing protein [Proteobacteria bacterium]|nr:TIR domain-containing protein [Pseudomonadota bacterium]MBU4294332.1 TIR domain-containing protein [Pseudomonadota bacterium]MCG2749119.1 TIR domain-containing protein [Desulfobulbaceae bacterium]
MSTARPTVFISYSHLDEEWKNQLLPHLKAFEQQGDLLLWHDRRIDTGADWYPEIQQAVEGARVAVCLITKNFLASDFITKEEVPALLKRREAEDLTILPLLVSPCTWQRIRWLKGIQMFPPDNKCLAAIKDETECEQLLVDFAVKVVDRALATGQNHEVSVFENLLGNDVSEGVTDRALPGLLGKDVHAYQDLLVNIDFSAEPPSQSSFPTSLLELLLPPVEISRLPVTGAELFGREAELELLDSVWEQGKSNVVCFVAWGGVGKSTLINKWLTEMAADSYRGAANVFGWSFYSQGTGERVTSADRFIADALAWFGDPDPMTGSPWDKGQRLAGLIKQQRTLLVLDGLEPLQAEHDFDKGRIKDPGLAALVAELARNNPGLCLITSREEVADLRRFPQTVQARNLEQISAAAGRALLRVGGVQGKDLELEEASREFGNHALAVKLLAAYLHEIPGHHIKEAADIPDLEIPEEHGRQPRRVMAALVGLLGDSPEVEYLRILGLFDRPADKEALAALLTPPAIPDLTGRIMAVKEEDRHECLTRLRRLGLLAPASSQRPGDLDCHPLVREHFCDLLREQFPAAWQQGNLRLYEYYKSVAKEYPETIEEMTPLFYACAHGCRAGRQQEALDKVYWKRISRKQEAYINHKLGALGSDLAALANFFELLWERPIAGLTEKGWFFLLGCAGFNLRALGQLSEASRPMEASLDAAVVGKDWENAAIAAANLSELCLALGKVDQAMKYGERSVELADWSGDVFQRLARRTTHASSLHQAGQLAVAEELFHQAEAIHRERQPLYPFLNSMPGFLYCDLLLNLHKPTEALERAEKALGESKTHGVLRDIGLDYLTLGRACFWLGDSDTAATHLDRAMDFLRKANEQELLVRGLLAQAAFWREQGQFHAARRDLDEVLEIVERCGMRLFLTDYHLESCRLLLAENDLPSARGHLGLAKKLVEETGYHRRDREVEELEKLLADVKR